MPYFFLFIFGLAIGSFSNVISLRYEPGQRLLDLKIIGGRSRCSHCQKILRWYELIPLLSFIIQFGKCRNCGARLFLQYPLVEFLSGLIFVSVPYYLINFQFSPPVGGFNFQSIFQLFNYQLLITIIIWLLVFLLFLLLSIIDFRHYIIPDSINLLLAILGIILIILNFRFSIYTQLPNYPIIQLQNFSFLGHYALLFDPSFFSILNTKYLILISHIFAAVVAMAFFAAIIIFTKGRAMGWGDFKLVGALGLIFGWPDILMVVFLSFIVGAICVTPLLIKKQKTMKDAVPFGPFLIIGSALTFFLGYNIINGYFKLFGI